MTRSFSARALGVATLVLVAAACGATSSAESVRRVYRCRPPPPVPAPSTAVASPSTAGRDDVRHDEPRRRLRPAADDHPAAPTGRRCHRRTSAPRARSRSSTRVTRLATTPSGGARTWTSSPARPSPIPPTWASRSLPAMPSCRGRPATSTISRRSPASRSWRRRDPSRSAGWLGGRSWSRHRRCTRPSSSRGTPCGWAVARAGFDRAGVRDVIELTVDGTPLLISYGEDPALFDQRRPLVDAIVQSIQFNPAG